MLLQNYEYRAFLFRSCLTHVSKYCSSSGYCDKHLRLSFPWLSEQCDLNPTLFRIILQSILSHIKFNDTSSNVSQFHKRILSVFDLLIMILIFVSAFFKLTSVDITAKLKLRVIEAQV